MGEIAQRLHEFVTENRLEDMVAVNEEIGSIYLRIQDIALFQPGSILPEEVSVAVIERLGEHHEGHRGAARGHAPHRQHADALTRVHLKLEVVRGRAGVPGMSGRRPEAEP